MRARIYQPARTAMQSGTAKTKMWRLEFVPASARSVDPLMGWTSSDDMNSQVRLQFDSREAAEAYAARAAARRADARFLAAAYSDPRIMAELDAARCRAEENNFDNALAPFGMDAPAVAKKRPFKVRLSAPMAAITNYSGRRTPLYYI